MDSNILSDGRVWCPSCRQHIHLLKIPAAAKIASVHKRTIYRYIEAGEIFAVKIAGHTYRVCGECLIKQPERNIIIKGE